MAFEFITHDVNEQKQRARYRKRQCVSVQNAREVVVDNKQYINFSSNDYLALNHHAEINLALQQGAEKFGTCASGSSLITGYSYAHQALEDDICEWLNKERCLLYASGFSANTALMQALGQKDCQLFLDKLSHASLIDGALGSDAKMKRFLHNDIEQLHRMLHKSTLAEQNHNIVVSEGVFSMDGDQANVQALFQCVKKHKAMLYLDDAHSIGVIGEQGAGSSSIADIDIIMATCGKSIATSGAFVACNNSIAEYLINFSRHYIYSTAISPALAWATKKSIELIRKEQWRRDKIKYLSELFVSKLDRNIELIPTSSSIHAVVIGDEQRTLNVCEYLKNKGIWLTAIRPPTVPNNSSRLRVTITSGHKENDINYLANCINEVLV